jgi:putative Holliday junction resolvase
MKIMALDIGDRWTGIAISDPLCILARPYTTVKTPDLLSFLETAIQKENLSMIVVGLPTTMRGTQSDQTKKIMIMTEELKKTFSTIQWKLWDERLTSKMASKIKFAKTKEDKLHSHALAAALILSSYLEYKRMQETLAEDAY